MAKSLGFSERLAEGEARTAVEAARMTERAAKERIMTGIGRAAVLNERVGRGVQRR